MVHSVKSGNRTIPPWIIAPRIIATRKIAPQDNRPPDNCTPKNACPEIVLQMINPCTTGAQTIATQNNIDYG